LSAACILISTMLGCAVARAGEAKFEPLPLEHPATTMALTEDGKLLLVAHEEANKVSVWDIQAGKVLRSVECPSPRFILCRGGQAYVANYGKGTITVLDSKENWEVSNQIQVGDSQVYYLSAPGGGAFANVILATCGTYKKRKVFSVDVIKDAAKDLGRSDSIAMATFQFDGGAVLDQYILGSGDAYETSGYLGGERYPKAAPRVASLRDSDNIPLFQVRAGALWFGRSDLYVHIREYRNRTVGDILFPDSTRSVFYAVKGKAVTAYRMNSTFPELASAAIQPPPTIGEKEVAWRSLPDRSHVLHQPAACTLGSTTHLFEYQTSGHKILHCQIEFGKIESEMDIARGAVRENGKFWPLPLEDLATTFAMTEDGKSVVVAHEVANRLSVWDVEARKAIKTISCPSPRHVLCRGGKVFVANYGKGTISEVDPARNWEIARTIKVGRDAVTFLSAPGGRYFQGSILASCVVERSSNIGEFFLLNTSGGSAAAVKNKSCKTAVFSFDGKAILERDGFARVYMAETWLSEGRVSIGRNENEVLLWQVREGPFWLGPDRVCTGMPPKIFGPAGRGLVFGDLTKPVFHVLEDTKVTTYRFDETQNQVASSPVATSPEYNAEKSKFHRTHDVYYRPEAASFGETTYLFFFDPLSCKVFHCATSLGGAGGGSGSVAVSLSGFPAKIVEGQPLKFRLHAGPVKGSFEVMRGPKSLSVATDGLLTWTPTPADLGAQHIKIRAEVGDRVEFIVLDTEVLGRDLAAKTGGDPSRIENLGVHYYLADHYDLRPSEDGSEILLQAGKELRVLDADGLAVKTTLEMPEPHFKAAARKDYFVLTCRAGVDIVDRKTMTSKRTIKLPGTRIGALVLHPTRPVAFVAIFDKGTGDAASDIEAKKVVMVNEENGEVKVLPRVLGNWLAIHPGGRYLYTAIHDTYVAGYKIDWHIGDIYPSYGSVDVVASYELTGDGVRHTHTNLTPGINGQILRISPDGAHISYVSNGGYRSGAEELRGYTIPAFEAGDIRTARVSYETGSYPKDVSYHPVLDLVAGCNEKTVYVFERRTGKALSGKVDVRDAKFRSIRQVLFAPGGRHLLVDAQDELNRLVVRAFPLRLTEEEHARLAQRGKQPAVVPIISTPTPTPPAPTGTPTSVEKHEPLTLADLGALAGASTAKKSPQEVARAYMDSVVVVKSEEKSGSGFLVSSKGYVLTCAHVLPIFGEPQVIYRVSQGEKMISHTVAAQIIKLDKERDLALLKISANDALPVVRLEDSAKVETGEPVSVIGHPGLGDKILDYTMTQGIVSNPKREVEGRSFIQTTAAINPGVSGGPMFNERGNVIGLVILKANTENTGFAVPAGQLSVFLKTCVSGNKPTQEPAPSADRECKQWMNMAENYRKAGKGELAREYFRKIIDKYPGTDYATQARTAMRDL
jgi:S1-C subfamily serine protease